MKLERYLQKNILLHICVVAIAITLIVSLFDFVRELRRVTDQYLIQQIIFYEIMRLPYRLYLLFPIECLVGTVTGLAYLISTREFIAMRLLGVSMFKFFKILSVLGLSLAFFIMLLGEFVIPRLEVYAQIYRESTQGKVHSSLGIENLWLKEKNNFIQIGYLGNDGQLFDFSEYRFDDNQALKQVILSKRGQYIKDRWLLYDGQKTLISGEGTKKKIFKTMDWDLDVSPNISNALSLKPEQQSIRSLFNLIDLLSKSNQDTRLYATHLWEKSLKPLLLVIMLILGLVSAFVPVRSYGFKMKTFVVIIIGFLFYMLESVAIKLGLIYGAPVWAGPLIPLLVASGIGIGCLLRSR